jgi:hypothetical protein
MITIALVCSVFASAANAQVNSVLRQLSRTGLVQEDINIMVRAGGELYRSGNAVPGTDTIWSNPATGAHGLVEVTSVEGDCVRLVYKFRARNKPAIQSVSSRRCLREGRWVLAP